jgi:hypothetical protein
MNFAAPCVVMLIILIAVLSPRLPPFFGYFLCRIGHDWETLGDPCQIRGELNLRNLVSLKFIDMTNVFRILSGAFALKFTRLEYSPHIS